MSELQTVKIRTTMTFEYELFKSGAEEVMHHLTTFETLDFMTQKAKFDLDITKCESEIIQQ